MSEATAAASARRHSGWALGCGLLTLILAATALLLPVIDWAPRGGVVGWLLFLAGVAELAFSLRHRPGPVSNAATGAGLITAAAGLLFIVQPFAHFFRVADVVMAWLFVRGAWMLVAALRMREIRPVKWVALSGTADLLLGLALVAGLPVAAFVISLFGPTPELVASFALILAASFLATGIAQVAIARDSP